MDTFDRLISAATDYDRKQETRKGYNRYALAQYFARLSDCQAEVAAGKSWRAAIIDGFSDRLRDHLLVAIGEPKA